MFSTNPNKKNVFNRRLQSSFFCSLQKNYFLKGRVKQLRIIKLTSLAGLTHIDGLKKFSIFVFSSGLARRQPLRQPILDVGNNAYPSFASYSYSNVDQLRGVIYKQVYSGTTVFTSFYKLITLLPYINSAWLGSQFCFVFKGVVLVNEEPNAVVYGRNTQVLLWSRRE